MIDKFTDSLFDIIHSPAKSLITTIAGTITGYLPTTICSIVNQEAYSIDMIFQRIVWTLTSVVAITAIISWVQKQVDRRKKRKLQSE